MNTQKEKPNYLEKQKRKRLPRNLHVIPSYKLKGGPHTPKHRPVTKFNQRDALEEYLEEEEQENEDESELPS